MKKQIYDEKNGMSYTLHGDYYLPDLVLNVQYLTGKIKSNHCLSR